MARILVVEDDGALRSIMDSALTAAGHSVMVAADGRVGVRVFGANRFDVVITDMVMPDIGGAEFVRTLRAIPSAVKIIAISGGGGGQGQEELLRTAVLLGADAALPKPFGVGELQDLVAAVLGSARTGHRRGERKLASSPPSALDGGAGREPTWRERSRIR